MNALHIPALLFATLLSLPAADLPHDNWRLETVAAPSLAANVLDDPAAVQIAVHLPPSYQKGLERYPVIYFLLGFGRGGPQETEQYLTILDGVDQTKQVPECIVVIVSGRTRLFGSFYVNSPTNGDWETFVTETLIAHIDTSYRTRPKREARAITGNSMGGFGALNLALRHPDLYSVCYAMSPGLYDENGLAESQMFKNGGTSREILALLDRLKPLSDDEARNVYFEYVSTCRDNNVLFTLAYSTAFSPNPKRAPYFDYPLVPDSSGRLIRDEALWERYDSGFGNVKAELDQYGETLRRYRSFTLNCGMNENYPWIFSGTAHLSRLLTESRIPHTMVWHDGTHGSRRQQQFRDGLIPTAASELQRQ